jgi:hypothetical protein
VIEGTTAFSIVVEIKMMLSKIVETISSPKPCLLNSLEFSD